MTSSSKENPFINLFVNILIPIFILNKMTKVWGPQKTLIIALAFPVVYGIYDLIRRRRANPFSILGIVNISVTGTLALLGLGGIWLAIKEALFPGLIGVFVFASSFSKKPFVLSLLYNPQIFHTDRISEELEKQQKKPEFDGLLKTSTQLLSGSFFLSACLNFFIGLSVFKPLSDSLGANERSELINQQIAQMTGWGFTFILVPSMICLMLIFWHLLKGLERITSIPTKELLKT